MNTYTSYKVSDGPPRRKVGTTRQSVSGIHLFRGEVPIPYESTLERDFLIRMEAVRSVLDVISQPVTIHYRVQGREYPYTPDYLVHYRQHGSLPGYGRYLPSELVEVKPKALLARHLGEWKPRFRAATRYCLENGLVFRLMHEDRIRDPIWKNMCFLARYRRSGVDPVLADWLLEASRKLGCMPVRKLVDACCFTTWGPYGKGHGITAAWHLVATGRLECDLFEPLSNSSVVWVADDE